MMPKLPVKELVLKGMLLPFILWKQVIHFSWPLFPFIAIDVLYETGFASEVAADTIENSANYMFLRLAAESICGAMVAVNLHRLFLLEQEVALKSEPYHWRERHVHFIVSSVGIGILTIIFAMPFVALIQLFAPFSLMQAQSGLLASVTNSLVWVVLMLPLYPVLSRMLLLLPAIAIESGHKLMDVWHMSKGHSFDLALIICIIPLAPYAITSMLYFPEYGILRIPATLIFYAIGAVEICLLSLSYKWIIENTEI